MLQKFQKGEDPGMKNFPGGQAFFYCLTGMQLNRKAATNKEYVKGLLSTYILFKKLLNLFSIASNVSLPISAFPYHTYS